MNDLLRHSRRFCKRNTTTILTCLGGVGVVTTTVMAVKATPKALLLLEKAEEEKGEKLTKTEKFKVAAPSYIPATLVGVGTIACIFGANSVNKRHQAALMSAYALLNTSYKDYKNKVKELHGEEFDKNVRTEIVKDKYEKEEDQNEDDGKGLFYDEYSQRYFRATNETVLRAEYMINRQVTTDWSATVNDFYDLLGIERIDGGDEIGWSSNQLYEMYWNDWVEFWHEKVELEDGMICYILHYTEPVVDIENY